MANLSPAVITREFALDLTVEQAGSSTGATVGFYEWGPVNETVLVNNKNTLRNVFGDPTDAEFVDWFTVHNFLSYTNRIYVTRVVPDGTGDSTAAQNAVGAISTLSAGDPTLIKSSDDTNVTAATVDNEDDYDMQEVTISTGTDNVFIAKYPGDMGNQLKVSMVDVAAYSGWTYEDAFDTILGKDEVAVVILLNDVIVETFIGSKDATAEAASGGSAYMAEILNRASSYVWCIGDNLFTDDGAGGYSPINWDGLLVGGDDGDTGTAEDSFRQFGWDLYSDRETIEVDFLLQGGASTLVGQYIDQNVAQVRQDCIAFLSPQFADVVGISNISTVVSNVITTRNTFGSSSYSAMDSNYKYQYDPYNDKYRWMPLNGDIAGLHARTDQERDPWWAAGGFNRGHIKNVVKLAYNPKKAFRDELYKNNINPVSTFQGDGPIFFGNKTLLTSTSSFSRINVRRLFNVLKRSIARMAKFQLFEFNDRFTQNQFKQAVIPFMRSVQSRRGVQDFNVVADDSNNTPEVIDNYQFVGDIYIKPSKAIETIYLNFVAVKTGVEFEEITLNGVID